MRGGEGPKAQKRQRHRYSGPLREGKDFSLGARQNDAVTGENDGPLGFIDEGQRGVDLFLSGEENRLVTMRLRRGCFPVERAGHLLRILSNVEEHGTGPVGRGDLKSL